MGRGFGPEFVHDAQAHQQTEPEFGALANLEVPEKDGRERSADQVRYHRKNYSRSALLFEADWGNRLCTSLRDDYSFNLVIAKTISLNTSIPVRFQRPADTDEKEHTDGREERGERNQRVHAPSDFLRISNAQEEQAY